jgi:hypothetical protein
MQPFAILVTLVSRYYYTHEGRRVLSQTIEQMHGPHDVRGKRLDGNLKGQSNQWLGGQMEDEVRFGPSNRLAKCG